MEGRSSIPGGPIRWNQDADDFTDFMVTFAVFDSDRGGIAALPTVQPPRKFAAGAKGVPGDAPEGLAFLFFEGKKSA